MSHSITCDKYIYTNQFVRSKMVKPTISRETITNQKKELPKSKGATLFQYPANMLKRK